MTASLHQCPHPAVPQPPAADGDTGPHQGRGGVPPLQTVQHQTVSVAGPILHGAIHAP